MPRKKKPAEGLESQGQDGEEEEEEKRNPANAKKKRSFVDAFIVISDSDGEQESKEESGLQKKRTKQLDRTKFAAKRKIAQLSALRLLDFNSSVVSGSTGFTGPKPAC